MKARVVETLEIRRREGGGFDLVLDGWVFPHSISREPVEVETLCEAPTNPLYAVTIRLFAEKVVGAEVINEVLLEEEDTARVRSADKRDTLAQVSRAFGSQGPLVAESDFENVWNA